MLSVIGPGRPPCEGQTELFFSFAAPDILAARHICLRECPLSVQSLCLERALVGRERYGVWGGINLNVKTSDGLNRVARRLNAVRRHQAAVA